MVVRTGAARAWQASNTTANKERRIMIPPKKGNPRPNGRGLAAEHSSRLQFSEWDARQRLVAKAWRRLSCGAGKASAWLKIFESPVTGKPDVRYSACLRLRITNLTRKTVLGDSIDLADTSAKRRTGLLKHERLAPGEGLWIVPCA